MSKPALQDDEFDIESLIYKLFLLFKKGLNWLLFPFKLLFTKPKRLGIIVIILFAVAVIIRYTAPPIYKSTFVLKPANPTDQNFAGSIIDIKSLIKDDDYEELASLLKLDLATCENLFAVEYDITKKNTFYKYVDSINAINITLYSYNRNLFDTFQKAIYNYIENSDYYLKGKNLRIETINELERKLNKDMSDIDSLKQSLTRNAVPRTAGGFVYGEPINPMNVYEKAILIYKEQLSLRYQSNYIESFELVKKCNKTRKRHWPRLSVLLPSALALAVIIHLIFGLVEINRKKKDATTPIE